MLLNGGNRQGNVNRDYLPSWVFCSAEQMPHDKSVAFNGVRYVIIVFSGMVRTLIINRGSAVTTTRFCSFGAVMVRVII